MTVVPSRMIPLGTKAPSFNLRDTLSGKSFTLHQLQSDRATVIMFLCNHCPFVKHIWPEILNVAHQYIPEGISFIAINSNDAETYSEDSPHNMKKIAEDLKFPFPYLYDDTQEVARAYGAECTPDFFVYDQNLACVYRGRFDDSRPNNHTPITGKDLKTALDCILKGEPIPRNQKPSTGCNIKWKREH